MVCARLLGAGKGGASVCWGTVLNKVCTTFVVGVASVIEGRSIARPLWVGSSSDNTVLEGLGDSEARNGAGQ